jgi:hypothetical protein
MKALIVILFLLFNLEVQAQFDQKTPFESSGLRLNPNKPSYKKEVFKPMNITFDWILETKAEILNGISYSPTVEFTLSRPNGMNFQIQTGALPVINGIKIDKTQPCAGISFGYSF